MFGDINITKDFLKNYLPEEILKITDLDNVTHEKESFIEKDLEEFYSDLLFRTNINGVLLQKNLEKIKIDIIN
jgi:predicted transposase YdaD